MSPGMSIFVEMANETSNPAHIERHTPIDTVGELESLTAFFANWEFAGLALPEITRVLPNGVTIYNDPVRFENAIMLYNV